MYLTGVSHTRNCLPIPKNDMMKQILPFSGDSDFSWSCWMRGGGGGWIIGCVCQRYSTSKTVWHYANMSFEALLNKMKPFSSGSDFSWSSLLGGGGGGFGSVCQGDPTTKIVWQCSFVIPEALMNKMQPFSGGSDFSWSSSILEDDYVTLAELIHHLKCLSMLIPNWNRCQIHPKTVFKWLTFELI